MDSWNDYLLPLVMLTTKRKFTLPIILSALNGQYKNEYNLLMAGALVSMLPILAVYAGAQKCFASGLQIGGVKG
jgi:multiple sugar transport system permease protein